MAIPSTSAPSINQIPTPSPNSRFADSRVPFPSNESYGIQQAWYHYLDEDNSNFMGSYNFLKTYPNEALEMGRRVSADFGFPMFIHKRRLNSIEQKCVNFIKAADRFAINHPALFCINVAVLLTGINGAGVIMIGASVFSPLIISISITVTAVSIAILCVGQLTYSILNKNH